MQELILGVGCNGIRDMGKEITEVLTSLCRATSTDLPQEFSIEPVYNYYSTAKCRSKLLFRILLPIYLTKAKSGNETSSELNGVPRELELHVHVLNCSVMLQSGAWCLLQYRQCHHALVDS